MTHASTNTELGFGKRKVERNRKHFKIMEQALTNKDCHILKEQWGQFSVGEALKGSKNQIKHGKS